MSAPSVQTTPSPDRPVADGETRASGKQSRALVNNYFIRQASVVAAFIIIWGLWVEIRDVNPLLVPSPLAVASAFAELSASGALLSYVSVTMRLLLTGIGIGVALAFVFTGLAIFFPAVRTVLVTLAAMFNPLPSVALLPLALLWFGIGSSPIVFVVAYSVIWAMALSLNSGFETVPLQLRWVGLNLGLSPLQNIVRVYIPATIPSLLTGFRLSWAYGWRTVIAAELVFGAMGGSGGIGWMIVVERYNLKPDRVFVGLITIIAIGLLVEAVFNAIENRTIRRWGMAN